MRLVVLGPPGAGKGTQARNLAKHFRIEHISTGDMLRDHMKRGTPLGLSITELMNAGQLVSDDIVNCLVRERLETTCMEHSGQMSGYILDGYPRNIAQAEVFDMMPCAPAHVIHIQVEDQVIMERMTGRVVCADCGAMFHTFYYPPQKTGMCDSCGGELRQREDDKAKTVAERLGIYHRMTEPIISFYRKKKLLLEVCGTGEMDGITRAILSALAVLGS